MVMSGGVGRTALAWLAGRWFRQRWLGAVPMALIIAVGGAGTMVAVSAAERTSNAYADYLERAEVSDLVINPSISTRQIHDVIHGLPGIARITSDVLYVTTLDTGEPRTRQAIDENNGSDMFVFGSSNGRYLDMDRPIVVEGRMPTGANEAVLSVEAAAAEGLGVGDVTPIAFWPMQISDGLTGADLERYTTENVRPVGVEDLRVVGIVRMFDEVLPDDLYPRQRMLISPDVAARYYCLPVEPPAGVTMAEAVKVLLVDDCSVGYEYYSMAFRAGAAGVSPALEAFVSAVDERNAHLATLTEVDLSDGPPSYFTVEVEPDRERQRVERANRPIIAAAWVMTLATAAVTLTLFGLIVSRELRRTRDEQRQWHRAGVSGRVTTTAVAVPIVVAVIAGVPVALVAGWWFDPGPMGLVAVVEPDAGRRLLALSAVAVIAIAAIAILGAILLCAGSVRRAQRSGLAAVGRRERRVPVMIGSPVVADSIRSAYGQRAAPPVLAGVAVLVITLVAALVFGTSLNRLLDTPHAYGWPWDAAAMMGGGYGGLEVDRLDQELGNDPNVAGWSVLGFVNEIALDGEPLMTIVGFDAVSDVDLSLLEGEMPRRRDEVALGTDTAADRGLELGDSVQIGVYDFVQEATVSALVVFPSLGPILSDRVGAGTGMFVPQALFDAPELDWLRADALSLTSFVGVDLVDDDPAHVADVQQRLKRFEADSGGGLYLSTAIRPPEIIDAGSTRDVPFGVAAVLAAVGAVGLGFAAWASVRARRRDVAVLRTLGFSDSQVRRSVQLQMIATMLAGLVVGVPVGMISGRLLWRAFAEQLGVLPEPASPAGPVVMALTGGMAIALIAAQLPAALATRARPAQGLRTE